MGRQQGQESAVAEFDRFSGARTAVLLERRDVWRARTVLLTALRNGNSVKDEGNTSTDSRCQEEGSGGEPRN